MRTFLDRHLYFLPGAILVWGLVIASCLLGGYREAIPNILHIHPSPDVPQAVSAGLIEGLFATVGFLGGFVTRRYHHPFLLWAGAIPVFALADAIALGKPIWFYGFLLPAAVMSWRGPFFIFAGWGARFIAIGVWKMLKNDESEFRNST